MDSLQSKKTVARDLGIKPPRFGTNEVYPSATPSGHKTPVDNVKHRGFKNYRTWELASYIQNNEGLYTMCKDLYEDGYKSFGAMRCKLMEFGPHWKPDALTTLYWGHDDISAREISAVLKDLFEKKPKKK